MFESPEKQNQSSPILATMFLLQSPESADNRRLIIYSVLLVLARGYDLSHSANAVWVKIANFLYNPLSFSALVRGDPFRTYGKALLILKLESSKQPMVKIW